MSNHQDATMQTFTLAELFDMYPNKDRDDAPTRSLASPTRSLADDSRD